MAKNSRFQVIGPNFNFSAILTCVFVALKLTHVINWPIYMLISPFWIPLVLVFSVWFISYVIWFVANCIILELGKK